MGITVVCTLAAGLIFTPPDGYLIEKVTGPPKVERRSSSKEDMVTTAYVSSGGTSIWVNDSSSREKVTIILKQTGKAGDTVDLPEGCTGEATSIRFRSKER